jgi:single-stranded DNA-binding protein
MLTDGLWGDRSLVMVEGDVSINQYEDADGKTRSAMNIKQRTSLKRKDREVRPQGS